MSAPAMLDYALEYATRGWRVHPIRRAKKLPMLKGWPQRATTDPDVIREWWRTRPDADIGIATGPESDLLVLDLDGADPVALLDGRELPRTPTQRTGGGGWQLLYRYPAELVDARTTKAGILPGVDTRGRGGYIVAPPSLHPSLRRYQWVPGYAPDDVPVAKPPTWLVELLTPPPPRPLSEYLPPPGTLRGSRYVQVAIERECAALARTPKGKRNDVLNAAAYTLARFIAAGQADGADVVRALTYAATAAGLGEHEIARTIASALGARRAA